MSRRGGGGGVPKGSHKKCGCNANGEGGGDRNRKRRVTNIITYAKGNG